MTSPLSRSRRVALVGSLLTMSTAFWLAGCGSSASVSAKGTTTGQELMDLENARNQGLLTEQEYQKKRKQILDEK